MQRYNENIKQNIVPQEKTTLLKIDSKMPIASYKYNFRLLMYTSEINNFNITV